MTYDNFHLFTMTYPDKEAAMAGFDAVEYVFGDAQGIDTYDAAIVVKKDGKVSLVRKREQAEHTKGWEGVGIGLAIGACLALFPAITLAVGALAGAAVGGAAGVIAGHIESGISRGDLQALGETLEEGQYSLVVITATDETRRVREATKFAIRFEQKQLKVDYKSLQKQLNELAAEA
ncbi:MULTISPECIES: hypothetical protein [unclassified Dyella]|uniref:hypothetical protein n=1 Tax=unclassified Dyella TaxID=2634549 RepID=UPI000C81ACEB|nr:MULTISPECIES: hypothetical protein [unclassified Dyella]MDR3445914.1 hypothetical protein [Dyella sp.]PMQ02855.1 hypothetical protein DyAD56_22250 [Dyella sp. AD56]